MHASVDVHPTFITTSDGLANNSVRYLFQDSKGFIWMGTLDGLSRYDGHSFVTFRPESGDKISLANHHVKKIQEDRNGFLWFITAPELMSCYDLKHDCFVDFTGWNIDGLTIKYWKLLSGIFGCGIIRVDVVK